MSSPSSGHRRESEKRRPAFRGRCRACGRRLGSEGASEATLAVFLAFGAAALIYLIAEELLVESIQAEESLFSTAMLFAGFAAVLAMKLLSHGAARSFQE